MTKEIINRLENIADANRDRDVEITYKDIGGTNAIS